MTTRKYLYEVGGKSGHVDADSVDDARRRLAGAGYTDAVVHDDDFLSDLRAADEKQAGIKRPADLEVLLRHDASALGLTLYVLRKNWVAIAVLAAAAGLLAATGAAWWIWVIALAIAASVGYALLFPGWLQWQQNEMHRRFWAGDWEASESIARRLRGLDMVKRIPAACLEFDARVAGCRVMKGDVAGAYALVAPWQNHPELAKGVWLAKANNLHFLARDWRRLLEGTERFFDECGQSDTAKIELAAALARYGDDDARAAALLDAIDPLRLVPIQIAFAQWTRGVLLLKRGDDDAAVAALAAAAGEMQKLAVNPLSWGAVALSTAYLSVAMARTGRRDAARAMLDSARSIVERHGEDLLLGWLRTEKLQA